MANFSFTFTKLKGFEKCARQHKAQLDKVPGMEPSGDAIDYGNRVHAALAAALRNENPAELPREMAYLQFWVDYVDGLVGEKHIEAKWGLTYNFQPTDFFGGAAWLRLIVDAAVVGPKIGHLIDWKTGRREEEPLQLWLGAAVMFAKFPHLEAIDSMFCWLKEDDGKNSHECISAEIIRREEVDTIWRNILPRVEVYQDALLTNNFPPSPGWHCRYCKLATCDVRQT